MFYYAVYLKSKWFVWFEFVSNLKWQTLIIEVIKHKYGTNHHMVKQCNFRDFTSIVHGLFVNFSFTFYKQLFANFLRPKNSTESKENSWIAFWYEKPAYHTDHTKSPNSIATLRHF